MQSHAQQVEQLTIVFERRTLQGSELRLFTPDRFPPNLSLVVRRLDVTDHAADFGGYLSPTELFILVSAFPKVTHLNIRLFEGFKIMCICLISPRLRCLTPGPLERVP